ncbi:Adenosine specific kinase, partial [mine drainage metagenome]
MEINAYDVYKNDEWQCIIGHAGFIKTAEDLYGAMASAVPNAKFGIAFVEASGERLIRYEGNDQELVEAAKKNAFGIAAGHTFI